MNQSDMYEIPVAVGKQAHTSGSIVTSRIDKCS